MKKLFILLTVIIISAMMTVLVVRSHNESPEILINDSVEALAGTEGCVVNPNDKRGKCKQNLNGIEYNCVKASWWEIKDCTSD